MHISLPHKSLSINLIFATQTKKLLLTNDLYSESYLCIINEAQTSGYLELCLIPFKFTKSSDLNNFSDSSIANVSFVCFRWNASTTTKINIPTVLYTVYPLTIGNWPKYYFKESSGLTIRKFIFYLQMQILFSISGILTRDTVTVWWCFIFMTTDL